MKKNKITFLILECVFLILTLFFAWKIFDRDVPEKRVAVILPESGDNRWNSLIKGMKQSAKLNNLHMIICNTDEIENAEMEKEIIKEQKRNNIDAFIFFTHFFIDILIFFPVTIPVNLTFGIFQRIL